MSERLKKIIYDVKKDFPEISVQKPISVKVNPKFKFRCSARELQNMNFFEYLFSGGLLFRPIKLNLNIGLEMLNTSKYFLKNVWGHEFSEILALDKSLLTRLISQARDIPLIGYLVDNYIHIQTDKIAVPRGYLPTCELKKEMNRVYFRQKYNKKI